MPANARKHDASRRCRVHAETNVREPVLNELPSGRIRARMMSRVRRTPGSVAGRRSFLATIFAVLGAVVGVLTLAGVVSGHAASIMLWALLGLYFAFGILIVMYRLICKLE
jgi:hypothetical protein